MLLQIMEMKWITESRLVGDKLHSSAANHVQHNFIIFTGNATYGRLRSSERKCRGNGRAAMLERVTAISGDSFLCNSSPLAKVMYRITGFTYIGSNVNANV